MYLFIYSLNCLLFLLYSSCSLRFIFHINTSTLCYMTLKALGIHHTNLQFIYPTFKKISFSLKYYRYLDYKLDTIKLINKYSCHSQIIAEHNNLMGPQLLYTRQISMHKSSWSTRLSKQQASLSEYTQTNAICGTR